MSHNNAAPRLRISGIVFAIAANLLAATLASMAARSMQFSGAAELIVTLIGPMLAGFATCLYIGIRGGMHAFIGGMLSVPILAYFVFPGDWRLAILSGAICALIGAFTEKLTTAHNSVNRR
jgi:hypothetical protein